MKLPEFLKPKQKEAQSDERQEIGMLNRDQMNEQADAELASGVAKHTGQTPKDVIPPSAQNPDLEAHKSGIPQFRETPRVGQKLPAATPQNTQGPSTLPHAGVVTRLAGQGARDLQRGFGEHIEEPPSFQPAESALNLNAKRTLKKAA